MSECNVCHHDVAMHDPEDGCHFFKCKCAKFASDPTPAGAAPRDEAREETEWDIAEVRKALASSQSTGFHVSRDRLVALLREIDQLRAMVDAAAAPRTDPDPQFFREMAKRINDLAPDLSPPEFSATDIETCYRGAMRASARGAT